MTLGVTDDQNYSNIADALREMGSGAEDLTFRPDEIPAAIRGLRSIWGTIEGSILDQTDLQNALNGKAAANHDHDSRYYTESEIDTKLNGKSNTGHTHDDRYYTESEIDTKLNGKSNINHTHDERYYTEAEIDTKLNTKSDITHDHDAFNISDVDGGWMLDTTAPLLVVVSDEAVTLNWYGSVTCPYSVQLEGNNYVLYKNS